MSGPLLLSYYGDDLTGSTDAMEALELHGVPTVLFLDPATPAQLARFPAARAIGLAGTSRSETPAWMDAHLPALFGWLKSLQAPICHYKVCSTFDSAAHVGSIGRALDIGHRVFGQRVTPVVAGVPQLKRYTLFGHHFAAFSGATYRLDRHPVMQRHPVTPMDESDLRIVLGRQTAKPVALVNCVALASDAADTLVDERMNEQDGALLFDVADLQAQNIIGRQLWRHRRPVHGLFTVGSSGVEYALVAEWQKQQLISASAAIDPPGAVDRIAVVSGSCSDITARQILWAEKNGFDIIPLDVTRLGSTLNGDEEVASGLAQAMRTLGNGRSVILYTALGSDSKMIAPPDAPHVIGQRLGSLLRTIVEQAGLRRIVIAGGDTSSHALRELAIFALTIRLPLPQTPGSPLCRAHSDNEAFDGIEVALKGGQIGTENYFGVIRDGGVERPGKA
ncbi:MAG: four-carbon acid sugar kinase family protein [Pseudomonadota bacterium]